MSNKITATKPIIIALFSIVGLAFLISRLRFMEVPLDRDEGSYLYLGKCFIEGYKPYIDFYEIKPPGIFLIYGLFHLLFGHSIFLLHIGILLTQLITAWLIYKIAISLYGQDAQGYTAASVYLIMNMFPQFIPFGILSEHFFVLFILLAIYILLKISENNIVKNFFISGLCFGFAAMIRQHAIFMVLPMFALIYYMTQKSNKHLIKNLSSFVLGSISIIILLISYVVVRGGIEEMVYWVFTYNKESYVSSVPWDRGKQYFFRFLNLVFFQKHYPILIIFGLGFIFLVRNIVVNNLRFENLLVLFFFIGSFATVFPGNRFYGHYWLMMFPFFALVSSVFIYSISSKTWYRYGVIVATFILFLNQLYLNKNTYFKDKADRIYQIMYDVNPNFALEKVTGFLKRSLKESEKIFVFGSEPQLYYETDKMLSIPHAYIGFIHSPNPRALKGQQETIAYLNGVKPEYIIHIQNSISVGMKEKSPQNLYNWIFGFEANNYTPVLLAEIDAKNNPVYYYDNEALKEPSGENYIVVYKHNKLMK
jgi:hypothetical protein